MATEGQTTEKLTVQYVVDAKGNRTAVLVPIELFEELVELAEQLEDIRHLEDNEAVPGEPIPWEQVKAELRAKWVADSASRHDVVAMAPEPDAANDVGVQYVVDRRGKRTAVLVPLELFEELVELAEQLEDIRYLEEAKKAPGEPIPLEELEAQLRAEGKLPPKPLH